MTTGSRDPNSHMERGSPDGSVRREVSSALFIGAIALVIVIVLVIAYLMFGPSSHEPWNNDQKGAAVDAGALAPPPPVQRTPRASGGKPMGNPGEPGGGGPGGKP